MMTLGELAMAPFWAADELRRFQGQLLDRAGFGPVESPFHVIASNESWRIRAYSGADQGEGPVVLIVSAPFKRPYIWDFVPSGSPVRRCSAEGLRVYLLEWLPPVRGGPALGLEEAARGIGEAAARVARDARGAKPFLMGHSLGGTMAAILACLEPAMLRGLVLVSSPLCFARGLSRFGDALAQMELPPISDADIVPGTLISQLSAIAGPETFIWSRVIDAAASITDLRALEMHARIERWTLDEVPLPGRLVQQILGLLYREDRFCANSLSIGRKRVGPSRLRVPTIAVANSQDDVAPPSSMSAFLSAAHAATTEMIVYPGEAGAGLQHLAVLVGARAHAQLWGPVTAWMRRHGGRTQRRSGGRLR